MCDRGGAGGDVLDAITIDVEPPSVQVRNRLEAAPVRQINMALQILRHQTASAQDHLDYGLEQTAGELTRVSFPMMDINAVDRIL